MQAVFKIVSLQNGVTYTEKKIINKKVVAELFNTTYIRLEHEKISWSIYKDFFGKPWITLNGKPAPISLSISDTDAFIFVGLSEPNQYIGVDVEKIRIFNNVLLNGFLAKEEMEYVKGSGKSFFKNTTKIWALKESILKAFGCGLRIRPTRINVVNLLALQEGGFGFFEIDRKMYSCRLVFFREVSDHIFISVSIDYENLAKFKSSLVFKGGLLCCG